MDQLASFIATTLRTLIEESGWTLPIEVLFTGTIDRRTCFIKRRVFTGATDGSLEIFGTSGTKLGDLGPQWSFDALASLILGGDVPKLTAPIFINLATDGDMIVATIATEGTEPRFVRPRNLDS